MPLHRAKEILPWLVAALLFVPACTKEHSCENCIEAASVPKNKPPVADAGPDQTLDVPVQQASLDGSKSTDPEQAIRSYVWVQVAGPTIIQLSQPAAAQTRATGFVPGRYQFSLTVTDTGSLFATDTVAITIHDTVATFQLTPLAPVPDNEMYFGSYHINQLVPIGGRVFTVSKLGSLWSYDSLSNAWVKQSELPPLMASSNYSVVFGIGNKGYFIGNGYNRQYDAAANTWVTKTTVPEGSDAVDYSVAFVLGTKAYLVSQLNKRVVVYDPVADTYTRLKDFPDAGAAAGFVINHIAYCVQRDGRCWQYDQAGDQWQQKASMPAAIYNTSGFAMKGAGYIIGDLNLAAKNGSGQLRLWRYDAAADKWEMLPVPYAGKGVQQIRTASFPDKAFVGLGYDRQGDDVLDFFQFR